MIQPSTVALKRRSWNIIFNRVGLLRFCPGITYHDLLKKSAFGFLKKWREDVRLKNGPPKNTNTLNQEILYVYIYINIFKGTWGSFFCPIAHPIVFYNQKRLLPTLPRSPNKMLELLLLTRFAGNRMPGTIKVSQKASSV